MNVEGGVQIDLLGAFRRRGLLACAIAGMVTLAMYWIAMALPNEYTSSAMLLVEPQSVNEKLVEAGAGRVDLNERLNLMTAEILSRTRLSRIIDDLEIYQEQSKTMTRDEIIDQMQRSISVSPVLPELTRGMKSTNIDITTFEIFFSSDTPRVAADVAQRLANDFIQEHIANRVKTTQTSLEFISAEQERLSKSIAEVAAEIAQVKESNQRSLPENLGLNQRMFERTESELRYSRRALDNARSDKGFWEHQVLAAAGQSGTGNQPGNPQRRLEILELGLAEMKAKGFTDRHPDMISTKHEIEEVRASIARDAEMAADGSEEAPAFASFSQQNAQSEVMRSNNMIEATQAEIERLELSLETLRADISATPRVAEQLEGLERTHSQLHVSLEGFSRLRQNAAVQADLERRQLGERFRILEPAIVPRKVSSPNRRVIIIMGVMLGMALGVGVGVVLEGTDPSYHGQRDLQSAVGFPVLAVIPTILFDADLAAQRKKRRIQVFVAAVVASVFLTGGVLSYIWVNGAPGWLRGILGSGAEGEEGEGRGALHELEAEYRPLA